MEAHVKDKNFQGRASVFNSLQYYSNAKILLF